MTEKENWGRSSLNSIENKSLQNRECSTGVCETENQIATGSVMLVAKSERYPDGGWWCQDKTERIMTVWRWYMWIDRNSVIEAKQAEPSYERSLLWKFLNVIRPLLREFRNPGKRNHRSRKENKMKINIDCRFLRQNWWPPTERWYTEWCKAALKEPQFVKRLTITFSQEFFLEYPVFSR
jgi:hypothetical protein